MNVFFFFTYTFELQQLTAYNELATLKSGDFIS